MNADRCGGMDRFDTFHLHDMDNMNPKRKSEIIGSVMLTTSAKYNWRCISPLNDHRGPLLASQPQCAISILPMLSSSTIYKRSLFVCCDM